MTPPTLHYAASHSREARRFSPAGLISSVISFMALGLVVQTHLNLHRIFVSHPGMDADALHDHFSEPRYAAEMILFVVFAAYLFALIAFVHPDRSRLMAWTGTLTATLVLIADCHLCLSMM